MGGLIEWSFRILQFSGKASCGPAAIRERDSPAGNGSSYVRHLAGYPRGAGIWRHGQACQGCDDKFIRDQRHCGLRRHLDGVPPETPIWEIVDSCRVWESHSDREPNSEDDQDRDSRRHSKDPLKLGCPQTGSQEVLADLGKDSPEWSSSLRSGS